MPSCLPHTLLVLRLTGGRLWGRELGTEERRPLHGFLILQTFVLSLDPGVARLGLGPAVNREDMLILSDSPCCLREGAGRAGLGLQPVAGVPQALSHLPSAARARPLPHLLWDGGPRCKGLL